MDPKHLIFAAVLAGAGFLFWRNMNEASAGELDFEGDEFLPSGAAPELTLIPGGLQEFDASPAAVQKAASPEFAPLGPSPMTGPSRRPSTTGIIGGPPISQEFSPSEKATIQVLERKKKRKLTQGEKTAVIHRLRQRRRQEAAAALRGKVAGRKQAIRSGIESRQERRGARRTARREGIASWLTR